MRPSPGGLLPAGRPAGNVVLLVPSRPRSPRRRARPGLSDTTRSSPTIMMGWDSRARRAGRLQSPRYDDDEEYMRRLQATTPSETLTLARSASSSPVKVTSTTPPTPGCERERECPVSPWHARAGVLQSEREKDAQTLGKRATFESLRKERRRVVKPKASSVFRERVFQSFRLVATKYLASQIQLSPVFPDRYSDAVPPSSTLCR